MGVEIVSVRWQARIFCVCGRDSVLERIPAWVVVVGRGLSENIGTEPPVSALHNRKLESGRSRLLLSRVQSALWGDIMASFFFYLSAIVMSLFISWGEGDKVEVCRGGAHPSGTQPSRSAPPSLKNLQTSSSTSADIQAGSCFQSAAKHVQVWSLSKMFLKHGDNLKIKKTHSTDCWACAQSEVLFGFKAFARSFQLPFSTTTNVLLFLPLFWKGHHSDEAV